MALTELSRPVAPRNEGHGKARQQRQQSAWYNAHKELVALLAIPPHDLTLAQEARAGELAKLVLNTPATQPSQVLVKLAVLDRVLANCAGSVAVDIRVLLAGLHADVLRLAVGGAL